MMKKRCNFSGAGLIFKGLVYQKHQSEKSGQSKKSKFRHFWAFALLFLLVGCVSEDMGGGVPDSDPFMDEWVPVRFTVGEAGFGDNEAVTRSALMDGEAPVGLRSDTLPLDMGIKVRIVLYTGYGYSGHADYEATVGGLLIPYPAGSPELSAPMGTNRFVAYSFNSSTPMDPFDGITAPIPTSQQVLWGDTVETVSHGAMDVHITMQHKMSRVVVHATAENLFSLNSVAAEIYAYEPTLTIVNGVLNPNGSLAYRPFSWPVTDPSLSTQVSDTFYVFTDGEPFTGLKISQMSINGLADTDARFANYVKPLEAGKSYALHVNFIRAPFGGTASRITWEPPSVPYPDGRYIITNDPRDAGLYFKFGSVVGVYSDIDLNSNTGRILTLPGLPVDLPFTPSRDIAWHPYTTTVSSWLDIDSYDNQTDHPKAITPEDNYHTTANVMNNGKGDPCRLVGLDLDKIRQAAHSSGSLAYTDIDNGQWRMPSPQENMAFTGYSVDQGSYPVGSWWWDEWQPGNISYGVAGAEFPQRLQGGVSKFLPAGRNRSGGTYHRFYNGYYWSNEYGSMLYFDNNFLQFGGTYDGHGLFVRCVKQSIEFEIWVEDWIDHGTPLGLGGEGDIIVN